MRERIEKENFSYLTYYGYPIATFVSVLGLTWMMVFGSPFVQNDVVLEPVVTTVESKSSSRKEAAKRFESLG